MRALTAFACIAIALAGGCKKNPAEETADHEPQPHEHDENHGELPRQVRLDAEAVKSAGIETQKAVSAPLAATVSLPGEIAAIPDRTAKLSAAVPGRLEQVSFNEGNTVKKGDLMALLRVPDVGRLRGAYASATARAKAARANLDRLKALKESGLGSDQAVLDADAEARVQESEARAFGDQLGAIGASAENGLGFLVSLRAPLAGSVVARDAVVGQPVNADHVLATIVDLSEVWFLGRIFEKDLERLKVGSPAEVQLNAFPNERFHGVVEHLGQQTDPVARTLTARVRLTNAEGRLRLGLFGTAHVASGERGQEKPALLVPRSAVVDVGDKKIVFVRAADGDYVVHEVMLGEGALGQVQVLQGLDEGEEVVSRGVFTLKSLLLKSTLAEDEH